MLLIWLSKNWINSLWNKRWNVFLNLFKFDKQVDFLLFLFPNLNVLTYVRCTPIHSLSTELIHLVLYIWLLLQLYFYKMHLRISREHFEPELNKKWPVCDANKIRPAGENFKRSKHASWSLSTTFHCIKQHARSAYVMFIRFHLFYLFCTFYVGWYRIFLYWFSSILTVDVRYLLQLHICSCKNQL